MSKCESAVDSKAEAGVNDRASTISLQPPLAPPSLLVDDSDEDKYGARPACFTSTVQEVLFVITCTMAIGLSSMTAGVITVISSFVGRDLGMTNAEITWLSAASGLSAGSFLLFFGKLADLFGRRSMFVGSLFLFSVLAVGAGFTQKPIQLDIICGFIGLTSAGAVPPAQGMLGTIYEYPSKRKNAAFACFSSGNPLGFVFGMLSAGIASQIFSWRASFWFLAIVYFLFTILAAFTMPKDVTEKSPLNMETFKRFDLVGVFLTIAGTGTFSAGLSLAGDAPHSWRTSYVIALLVIGILSMIAFVFWELHYPTPLLDLRIFRDRNFSLLLSTLLLGFLAFNSASFWVSLYFQRVYHATSIMTAVYLLPMAVAGTLVNVVAGIVLHRVSNKLLMGIATCSFTLAYLLFALNKTSFPYWAMLFTGQIFSVVGVDLEFNVVNMYIVSSLSREQQSVAGGFFQMTTKLCSTIGLGISTAIYDSVQKNPTMSGYHAGDPAEPYAGTFWFAMAACALSIFMVPALTIGTQGHKVEKDVGGENGKVEKEEKQDTTTD